MVLVWSSRKFSSSVKNALGMGLSKWPI